VSAAVKGFRTVPEIGGTTARKVCRKEKAKRLEKRKQERKK